MRVLVGCEESQVVTQAFRELGHDACSCDLIETRGDPEYHIKGDVFDAVLSRQWDLIILHPDCTAMALSGNRWYGNGTGNEEKRIEAVRWTTKLWHVATSVCDRVALENPKSVIFPVLRRAGAKVQYIQPYQFGHMETKSTGFALHGLPLLTETDNVEEEMNKLPAKERHRCWYSSPGKNRKRDRSKTYKGIASALSKQWGDRR